MITLVVGLLVMLPSQMSIIDDFSRRWTDIPANLLWHPDRVRRLVDDLLLGLQHVR
jgi:hypothetical protein